ncbi:MAG TPA: DUF6677 family protein [Tepidisphaeraceae bacterium]
MADADRSTPLPVPLVALCGWILPGLGYVLVGQRARGLIAGGAVLLTFLMGLLIGGVRVVDVPGYDVQGQPRMLRVARGSDASVWALRANFKGEVFNKPWYIAQALVGPVNALATWGSLRAADASYRQATARVFDIGTLYTAVAGMLNLLIIVDATYRATQPPEPDAEPAESEDARTPVSAAPSPSAVADASPAPTLAPNPDRPA